MSVHRLISLSMGINSSKGINSNTCTCVQLHEVGTLIHVSSDGRNNTEIASRLAQARKNFQRMNVMYQQITTSRFTQESSPGVLHVYMYMHYYY